MNPILLTLEHQTYILECLADDIPGEAKTETDHLASLLESDARFALPGSGTAASELRKAGSEMRKREGHFCSGKSRLFQVSRALWKQVLAELPA